MHQRAGIWERKARGHLLTAIRSLVAAIAITTTPGLIAGTFLTFGPEDFPRTGSPYTRSFSVVNPSLPFTLRVFNGGNSGQFEQMLSSGTVTLNGTDVVVGSDFNQGVREGPNRS